MTPTAPNSLAENRLLRRLDADAVASLAERAELVRAFRPALDAQETLRRFSGIDYWFHSVYLGHGLLTAGARDTFAMLELLQLPRSLTGKSVLDIGSAEGFFSFECEARGAARVIALDHPLYRNHRPTIRPLKELYGSSIELVDADIEEAATLESLEADVVLFLGVLYHLRDPFLALRRLRAITGEVLYLETHVVDPPLSRLAGFGDETPPIAVFYERDELAGDASNWWGPNVPCLLAMLRAAGFERLEVLSHAQSDPWRGRALVRAEAPGR